MSLLHVSLIFPISTIWPTSRKIQKYLSWNHFIWSESKGDFQRKILIALSRSRGKISAVLFWTFTQNLKVRTQLCCKLSFLESFWSIVYQHVDASCFCAKSLLQTQAHVIGQEFWTRSKSSQERKQRKIRRQLVSSQLSSRFINEFRFIASKKKIPVTVFTETRRNVFTKKKLRHKRGKSINNYN